MPTFISVSFPTKILCLFTFCEYVVTYEQNGQNHKMKCFMKKNLITPPNSNKAKEKQSKTKPDIHVVVHLLGVIEGGPPCRCQGPTISVSPRRRVMVAKALRIPYGNNPILAPMDGAGLSTAPCYKRQRRCGKYNTSFMHACLLP